MIPRVEEAFKVEKVTLVGKNGFYLYASQPEALFEAHKHKMDMTIKELLDNSSIGPSTVIVVYSKSLNNEIFIRPTYQAAETSL